MNKEKTIVYEGVKLHAGQKRIIQEILSTPAKFSILNCSRQYGKSVLASQLILYYAINFKNTRNLYATPIHSQAKKVFERILGAILQSGVVAEHNRSDMTITLINGSVMLFSGVERYDNLRGESTDVQVLDEYCFMHPNAFSEALRPMLLVRGKKCIIISTPKGKRNSFFKMAQMGLASDQLNYSYHKGDYTENPFYDLDEIADAKRNLPDYVYRQEYLGEFIENAGEIFTNTDQVFCLDKFMEPGSQTFGGLDFGRQEDFTVLTILNQKGELVFQYRDRQKPWETIINNVVMYLKKYNTYALAEVNGIGDVLFEMLKTKYSKVEPFQTTNSSKQQIIELLSVEFQNKTISLLKENLDPITYNELLGLEFEYNVKTRTVKYGAPIGLHDDTVMSLAMANQCRRNNRNYGKYAVQ